MTDYKSKIITKMDLWIHQQSQLELNMIKMFKSSLLEWFADDPDDYELMYGNYKPDELNMTIYSINYCIDQLHLDDNSNPTESFIVKGLVCAENQIIAYQYFQYQTDGTLMDIWEEPKKNCTSTFLGDQEDMKIEKNCPICGYKTKDPEGFFIGIICGCCGNEICFDDDITSGEIERFGPIIISKAKEMNLDLNHFENDTLPLSVAHSLLRLVWVAKGCPWIHNDRKEKAKEWNLEVAKIQLQAIGQKIEDYYTDNTFTHTIPEQYEKDLSSQNTSFCPICGYSFVFKGGYVMYDECGCCSYVMEIDNHLREKKIKSFSRDVLIKAVEMGYDINVYDGYNNCSEFFINVLLRIQWIQNGFPNKNAQSQGISWDKKELQKQLSNIHIDLNNYL